MTISANSLDELKSLTKKLETNLAAKLFHTKIALYRQLEGFNQPYREELTNYYNKEI